MRLAIIGGDAAGMSAASAAKRRDSDLDVVAFERGPYTSYSACGIPYYVGGLFDDADRLVSRSPEEHRQAGIDMRVRSEVRAIDLDRRVLTVFERSEQRETEEGFDELVIATGAVAVPPPIPGAEAVETARTVDAAERFRAGLERGGGKAVVIGAGYIGLEMAENLVDRGMSVTVIDQADQVMRTLDRDMADHVQDGAEAHGVRFLLSTALHRTSPRQGRQRSPSREASTTPGPRSPKTLPTPSSSIKRTDLLPHLADMLDRPDPRSPQSKDGKVVVRELVRVNHLATASCATLPPARNLWLSA